MLRPGYYCISGYRARHGRFRNGYVRAPNPLCVCFALYDGHLRCLSRPGTDRVSAAARAGSIGSSPSAAPPKAPPVVSAAVRTGSASLLLKCLTHCCPRWWSAAAASTCFSAYMPTVPIHSTTFVLTHLQHSGGRSCRPSEQQSEQCRVASACSRRVYVQQTSMPSTSRRINGTSTWVRAQPALLCYTAAAGPASYFTCNSGHLQVAQACAWCEQASRRA